MSKMVGWLKGLRYQQLLLVVGAVILVAGLVVGAIMVWPEREQASPVVELATEKAQAASGVGDYSGAYRQLKAAEDQAMTKAQKVVYYGDLSAAANNSGKLDEAISYLKLRHELDAATIGPDAALLASYYERTGKTADALAQYKLAQEYYESQPTSIENSVSLEGVKVRIAELEGGQ